MSIYTEIEGWCKLDKIEVDEQGLGVTNGGQLQLTYDQSMSKLFTTKITLMGKLPAGFIQTTKQCSSSWLNHSL